MSLETTTTGVQQQLEGSKIPLSVAALRRGLRVPRPETDEVSRALETLKARGGAFTVGGKWTASDPLETAAARLLDIVSASPAGAPLARLRDELRSSLPGYSKVAPEALARLVERGAIHPHYAFRRNGTRSPRPIAFAIQEQAPPEPLFFLEPARTAVRRRVDAAHQAGLRSMEIASEVRRMAASDREVFLEGLARLADNDPPGSVLSLGELRWTVALDKSSFDRTALALRNEGAVRLFQHDAPATLGRVERGSLVVDRAGTHYVGITKSENA